MTVNAAGERGRRLLIVWMAALLTLITMTRLAVLAVAINGRDSLLWQLAADALVVGLLLAVYFRGEKWPPVAVFGLWGLGALVLWASGWRGVVAFSARDGAVLLLAEGAAGVALQVLALLTAGAFLAFAVSLAYSRDINSYMARRRGGPDFQGES